ncbi:MAG TPA: FtsX-like permease family protein, partial [Chloroflexota bacterium]|nr:FtsX-like permease family protein [Chloroflexota bacterium]
MNFQIVGITTGRAPQGSEQVFIPLAAAQTTFNLPGQINIIEARFAANADADAVRAAVLTRLGSSYKVGGATTGSEFTAALEAANYIYNMFGVIAIALGGFIIFITFRTVVVERRRDIGMLRAIGASRKTVLGLILTESLVMGVIGTAVGIAFGYLMAAGLLVGMQSILENLMRTSVSGPVFAPWVFVLAIGLGVGITLLAGLFPALAAMRVSPLEALRPSLAEVERRRAGRGAIIGAVLIVIAFLTLLPGNVGLAALGILLFVMGLALVLPALIYPLARIFGRLLTIVFAREGQIAQGNLTRQPGRAAITASVITIGLSLLVAMGSLIVSLQGGMTDWINTTLGSDYLFMPPSLVLGGGNIGAGSQMMADIEAVPGVERATSLRLTTSQIDGTDLQVIGLDPVTYPQMAGLIFSDGDEKTAFAALGNGRAIIVNGIFAAQNAVSVGDELTLQTPNGAQAYQVAAIGGDFLNFKLATGYISQANLAQDFNETTDMLVMVDRAASADAAPVAAGLQQIAAGYPAFTFYSLAEWQSEMDRTMAVFNGMYVLLIILALPSLIALINTLAINVLERTREIGTLRAVGATPRQVRRMITAERLML